ncbi:2-amino-4-hydroxy-6-hydroxymethyldihydropteridine diphosphokinase [Rhizobium sp. CSW-27]|nr:2-amino-4-hydroxy-6-hydroxymethyldihydropteridine diphosphokinase [Rhizobium sp. CSW-27]
MSRCVLNTVPETGAALADWQRATLGLGGNIGDPRTAMAAALQALDGRDDCRVRAVSRLYRTPPWGKIDQADFFNSCALIETRLSPKDLLDLCLSIERGMKRVRLERWGPRTIDIDLLTYGDCQVHEEGLDVPHPRMVERGFVLMPLADIAPELMVLGKTVSAWLDQADTVGIVVADEATDWWRG